MTVAIRAMLGACAVAALATTLWLELFHPEPPPGVPLSDDMRAHPASVRPQFRLNRNPPLLCDNGGPWGPIPPNRPIPKPSPGLGFSFILDRVCSIIWTRKFGFWFRPLPFRHAEKPRSGRKSPVVTAANSRSYRVFSGSIDFRSGHAGRGAASPARVARPVQTDTLQRST